MAIIIIKKIAKLSNFQGYSSSDMCHLLGPKMEV